jgi:hypothetical protein
MKRPNRLTVWTALVAAIVAVRVVDRLDGDVDIDRGANPGCDVGIGDPNVSGKYDWTQGESVAGVPAGARVHMDRDEDAPRVKVTVDGVRSTLTLSQVHELFVRSCTPQPWRVHKKVAGLRPFETFDVIESNPGPGGQWWTIKLPDGQIRQFRSSQLSRAADRL